MKALKNGGTGGTAKQTFMARTTKAAKSRIADLQRKSLYSEKGSVFTGKMLCLTMRYMTGPARSQTLLLPPAIDDYVGPDNAVRFIDAFVDGLDLAAHGLGGVLFSV